MAIDISSIVKDEFIELEEAKDRYIEIVKNIPIHNHAEFCEAYNSLVEGHYNSVSQSTVSTNFSKFGIRKNSKTKLYEHKIPLKFKTAAYRYLFSNLCSKISMIYNFSELLYFKVSTELGNEQTIARIIYELLPSDFMIIPCVGCVTVMHSDEKRLNIANKKIKNYIHYKNKK